MASLCPLICHAWPLPLFLPLTMLHVEIVQAALYREALACSSRHRRGEQMSQLAKVAHLSEQALICLRDIYIGLARTVYTHCI